MTGTLIQHSHAVFSSIPRRSIIPLLARPEDAKVLGDLPDLNNVQGDVIYLFPKKAENFIFFRINDLASFKTALKSFNPTTSEDVRSLLLKINDAKAKAMKQRSNVLPNIEIAQFQIAFSRMGLYTLGVKEPTGDARFDKFCMRDNKKFLDDQSNWDDIFDKPYFDPVNGSVNDDRGALHGVITVAAYTPEHCDNASEQVIALFGSSVTIAGGKSIKGRARPPPYKGHEHFGYKDGISQPAIRGLVAPHPGQIQVDPGVIVMGYKGDPILEDPSAKVKRPAWTKDGTILVFRKLEQDVIGFEGFGDGNGKRWREFIPGGTISPPLTDQEGADLFGARFVGRWKSGAPLARCPFRDDPTMADDPNQNNDFDYVVRDDPNISPNKSTDYYCPFTLHTRKTAPRNLGPYIGKRYLESSSIVRGGLPYGPEVTDQERKEYNPKNPSPRELLFVCYMSTLDDGFVRQSVGYATNDYFPVTSLIPQKHGQDPIIGGPPPRGSAKEEKGVQLVQPFTFTSGDQTNLSIISDPDNPGDDVVVSGFVKVTSKGVQPSPGSDNPFFVTSRGGEYFFVPSASTLKDWAYSS